MSTPQQTAFSPDSHFRLQDRLGRLLGRVRITGREQDWVFGKIAVSESFAAVAPLFGQLESLANNQILSSVDQAVADIADLGLVLVPEDGGIGREIDDVQVMNDDDICFRER